MAERMVQLGTSSRSFITAPEERRRSSRSFIANTEAYRRSSRSFFTANDVPWAQWRSEGFSWERIPVLLLASIVSVALVMSSVLFLVWVRMAEIQAGYAVYQLQGEKVRLRQTKSALEVEIASLRRPDRLHRLAAKYGLQAPRAEQILHISQTEMNAFRQQPGHRKWLETESPQIKGNPGGAR